MSRSKVSNGNLPRVVVTGMGIVSSIGNNQQEVCASLREGRSGLSFNPEYVELGLNSHVVGSIALEPRSLIPKTWARFLGDGAAYSYIAMQEALWDAGLKEGEISDSRIGLVMGSAGASTENVVLAADLLRKKGIRRVGPFRAPRMMSSTISACLSTAFGIRGVNYSISSACATSAHCIGHAMELIQMGKQDMVFAGGGEEIHWTMTMLLDAMGGLSTKYNNQPQSSSRPFDSARDGFVISGGGGMLVLESLEHAEARGAHIISELVGYGATSDGFNMVQPSGEGAIRCMRDAMANLSEPVDYINAHGTGTIAGDLKELEAIQAVFGDEPPLINSTKSLTGHALGAAGVHEAIYSLLMMRENFICASANIDNLDPGAEGMPIVKQAVENSNLRTVMSNSFGFGGTNACLVFR